MCVNECTLYPVCTTSYSLKTHYCNNRNNYNKFKMIHILSILFLFAIQTHTNVTNALPLPPLISIYATPLQTYQMKSVLWMSWGLKEVLYTALVMYCIRWIEIHIFITNYTNTYLHRYIRLALHVTIFHIVIS